MTAGPISEYWFLMANLAISLPSVTRLCATRWALAPNSPFPLMTLGSGFQPGSDGTLTMWSLEQDRMTWGNQRGPTP